MRVVPQAFYENPSVRKVMVDGLCAVLHKAVLQPDEQKERYLAAHAFTLVQSGTLRVSDQSGEFIQVPQGHLVFLPRGLYMVSDLLPANGAFAALVCFVDDELLASFRSGGSGARDLSTKEAEPEGSEEPLVIPANPDVLLFAGNLLELYREGSGTGHEITRPKLLEFLHLLHRSAEGPILEARLQALHRRRKKSLVEFMETNFSKRLRIEDFAYLTGRSVSTFHRDFKARFGLGPKQWLIRQRLAKAREMLESGQVKVTEVAQSVGYENVPHFIKSFRRRYGVSPGQYGIGHRSEAAF